MTSQQATAAILPENYRILQESVYTEVGIVLREDKHYLFEGRLGPIVQQLGLRSINELCEVLQANHKHEVRHMVAEAMTTNETYFFRDPAHYEAIKTVLLPKLKEDRMRRKMSFWSAASSSGQEAYSLAMLLLEQGVQDWNVQILGTDFSSKVVEKARSGVFQQLEVNRGLPANLLVKYFKRTGLNWQLSDAVRRMVQFEFFDLRKSMRTMGPFDLVFCRNVMIYFDEPTRKQMMKEIHGTLFQGGWLLLGGSEIAADAGEWFEKQTIGNATVYVAR